MRQNIFRLRAGSAIFNIYEQRYLLKVERDILDVRSIIKLCLKGCFFRVYEHPKAITSLLENLPWVIAKPKSFHYSSMVEQEFQPLPSNNLGLIMDNPCCSSKK
jgi:hypothetical protein